VLPASKIQERFVAVVFLLLLSFNSFAGKSSSVVSENPKMSYEFIKEYLEASPPDWFNAQIDNQRNLRGDDNINQIELSACYTFPGLGEHENTIETLRPVFPIWPSTFRI
jgi:hypothetical protein